MAQLDLNLKKEFTDFGLYCGLGGMAIGTARVLVRMGGYTGRFRCLGGIDVNQKACRNFGRLVGVPATCMDLFDREQYRDWHGTEPPETWEEATPADILRAAGGEHPDLVELSAPCKGLSGLLSGKKSRSNKYQALNRLTVRGVFLTLEAFKKDLPAVIFFENVPRIQTRGADLLMTMKGLLESYGYAVHMGVHNAGKLYGGGQNRIRFFLIARNVAKVPKLIYKPRELPLQSIGDVLSRLPWPGDVERGGPMHRLPQISETTAARLACIRPGKDWRDLQGDLSSIRLAHDPRHGAWLVSRWSDPANAITGAKGIGVSNSPTAVAHPLDDIAVDGAAWHDGAYEVEPFDRPADCVTSGSSPSAGATVMQDIRVDGSGKWTGHALRVTPQDQPCHTVTSADGPSCGAPVIAQGLRRVDGLGDSFAGSPGLMGVIPYDSSSPTVSASAGVTSSNMPAAVQDKGIRLGYEPRGGGPYGVAPWNEAGPTVLGSSSVRGSNTSAVQDLGIQSGEGRHTNHLAVQPYDAPARTATGATHVGNGGQVVQDKGIQLPERGSRHKGKFYVQPYDSASRTVTGGTGPNSNALSLQDKGIELPENPGRHTNKFLVQHPDEPSRTITTSDRVGSGAPCMSDMRISESKHRHTTKYRVQDPNRPAATVTSDTDIQTGAPSVADRGIALEPTSPKFNHAYNITPYGDPSGTVASGDSPSNGGICVEDRAINGAEMGGTAAPARTWYLPVVQPGFPYFFTEDEPGQWSWHRPLTTLDLAALQDLLPELIRAGGGVPLALEGSDKERREQIGNAVPPGAMQFVGTVIMYAMMKGRLQDESVASDEVWVQEDEFLDFTRYEELMEMAS